MAVKSFTVGQHKFTRSAKLVSVYGKKIDHSDSPGILGVTFDNRGKSGSHCKQHNSKMPSTTLTKPVFCNAG